MQGMVGVVSRSGVVASMKKVVIVLSLIVLVGACSFPNAFSASDRKYYRSNVCAQYLSPESTTPNLAGRGRSCLVQSRNQ